MLHLSEGDDTTKGDIPFVAFALHSKDSEKLRTTKKA
jgi:hypothetical protein